MPNTEPERAVHVAVGVVINQQLEVLIALRDPDRHQGGLWEFPGGKVESGETVAQALARELLEEVHLQVESCSPLMTIHHDYGDKRVVLDVRLVDRFHGEARGREGQEVRWVGLDSLHEFEFPAANYGILETLQQLKRKFGINIIASGSSGQDSN